MKYLQTAKKYGSKLTLATVGLLGFSAAQADLVADATTKIGELETAASAMGTPILGIIAAVTLIGIIVMLVKRAR